MLGEQVGQAGRRRVGTTQRQLGVGEVGDGLHPRHRPAGSRRRVPPRRRPRARRRAAGAGGQPDHPSGDDVPVPGRCAWAGVAAVTVPPWPVDSPDEARFDRSLVIDAEAPARPVPSVVSASPGAITGSPCWVMTSRAWRWRRRPRPPSTNAWSAGDQSQFWCVAADDAGSCWCRRPSSGVAHCHVASRNAANTAGTSTPATALSSVGGDGRGCQIAMCSTCRGDSGTAARATPRPDQRSGAKRTVNLPDGSSITSARTS